MRCFDEENTEEVELLGHFFLVGYSVCFVFNILLLDGSTTATPLATQVVKKYQV